MFFSVIICRLECWTTVQREGELLRKDLLSRTLKVCECRCCSLLQLATAESVTDASSLLSDETVMILWLPFQRIASLLLHIHSLNFCKHFYFFTWAGFCCSPSRQESTLVFIIKCWKLQERKCTHFRLVWKPSCAACGMIWIICHCGDWRLYQLAGHLTLLCCREARCSWNMCQDVYKHKHQTVARQHWSWSGCKRQTGEQITFSFWQAGGSKLK